MNSIFLLRVNKLFRPNEYKLFSYIYLYYSINKKPYYRYNGNLEKQLNMSKASITKIINKLIEKDYLWKHNSSLIEGIYGYTPNYSLLQKIVKEIKE